MNNDNNNNINKNDEDYYIKNKIIFVLYKYKKYII